MTAFAFDSDDPAFDYATFYRYEIVNKGTDVLENLRVGFFNDADIGTFTGDRVGSTFLDDYVGSDPERGLSFVYNSDDTDDDGYESLPPALGVDVLSGAEGMMYYNNDASPTGNPSEVRDWFRYLNFTWRDGRPVTRGGTGYNPGIPSAEPTTWFFPGAPETAAFWSERNLTGNGDASMPGDRRFVAVATPQVLGPGESAAFDFALLFAVTENNLESVAQVRQYSDRVQAAYDAGNLFPPVVVADEANEVAQRPGLLHLEAYPNPTRGHAMLRLDLPESGPLRVAVYDLLGREVMQLARGQRAAGTHRVPVDISALMAGFYVVTAETASARATQRLLVVR